MHITHPVSRQDLESWDGKPSNNKPRYSQDEMQMAINLIKVLNRTIVENERRWSQDGKMLDHWQAQVTLMAEISSLFVLMGYKTGLQSALDQCYDFIKAYGEDGGPVHEVANQIEQLLKKETNANL